MILCADLTYKPIQSLVAAQFFKHRHVMVMLPRQEGKTELGVRLMRSLITPEHQTRQGLFLAKSKTSLKKMSSEKFKRLFDDQIFEVNTEVIYNKKNQFSKVFIDSVDKDTNKLRGGTYHLIHWAEVAFSELQLGMTVHDVHSKILKWTLKETNGMSYYESTANGDNGWKEMWLDYDRYPDFKRICYSGSQLVDMGLMEQSFFDDMKSKTPRLEFEQEVECKFVTFTGRAYEEFKEHHIWNEMPGPNGAQVFFAIDWGWEPSATCVLFGFNYKGRICIFDEIYSQHLLNSDLMALIQDKFNFWKCDKVMGVGDHDPKSIQELLNAGIPVGLCDKVNVLGNRMEVKTLFKQNNLYIHPRCSFVIKDLNNAVFHAKKNDGSLDDGKCKWGHWDGESTLRYLIRMFAAHKEQEYIPLASNLDEKSLRESIYASNNFT